MHSNQRILAVGFSAIEHQHSTPFLDREGFDVDRFPRAAGALELLRTISIDVVLVRYPLGMDLAPFLRNLREPGSASRHASLVILAEAEALDEAHGFIGRGANRVIGLGAEPGAVQEIVAGLLRVAPRRETRFLARLQASIEGQGSQVLAVVRNTSASGMLVETEHRFDVGTVIRFELTVPASSRPVRGEAEVVRHSDPQRERVLGMGVRILSFEGDDQSVYGSYLESQA
ncbi:MAG: PilZ domain-containing protein [Holophagales bacterium]|nr:PilZ domain-containing protein [Holophagales bacterium]